MGDQNGSGDNQNQDQNANGDASNQDGGKNSDQSDQKPKVTFTDEQQAELNRIVAREARKAADKAKADADAARSAADDAAQKKADQDAAAARGDFEKVRIDLEKDRDDVKADVTRLTGEVDQYKAAMKAGIDAGWNELPEAVRKLGEKQHPEDDVLGRWDYLNDPDTAALVKELAGKATARGNGLDPRSDSNGKPVLDEAARVSNASRYR